MKHFLLGIPVLSITLLAQAPSTAPSQEQKDFFENHIRPVLAQNCFTCHTNSQMGGLRLDSLDGMLKGGKHGPAVVAGDPEKSYLITAIRQSGEIKMPKNGHLTDAQIADITNWVKDGAIWPTGPTGERAGGYVIKPTQKNFWSFQPLAKPEVPKVKDAAWPSNNIDKFILAKLDDKGMKPAPVADRRALLRRVTYVLTGLPATYEEVKAFEADKSPAAYEKAVDRLMASNHFGEMWARHWLDVTRYAEDDYRIAQKDMHKEKYKFAYTYRDWVISAMNNDMPYDVFVKAQLAGDQMDESVRGKMIPGLGMNGLGMWQMNDSPPAQERADEWNDKVDATSKALLGLTVGCARCHDHKYDPIPTKDYYRMAGIFANTNYHAYPLVPKAATEEYDAKKKELEEKEKSLKEFEEQVASLQAQTLFSQTEDYMVAAWRVAAEKHSVAAMADKYKLDPEMLDRWVKFLKKKPSNYSFLMPWQKMVASGGDADQAKTLAHTFYDKAVSVDKEHEKLKKENEEQLAKMKDPNEKFDPLPNGIKRKLIQHQIDLKAMDRESSYLWRDMFEKDLNDNPINENADEEKRPGLFKFTDWSLQRRLSPDFAAFMDRKKADIDAFKKAMPPEYPVAAGLQDIKDPSDLKIFIRGNPYAFGEDAPRAFLQVLSNGEQKPYSKGSGRLEFAEDVVKQPIAQRVYVNRLWRWAMGTGIVDTPNNFGFAGERPSNPELLEYLTSKFMDEGMSSKKVIKEIVMSKTFQLSSAPVQIDLAKDGDNRFYWRANRRRLEAEGIWDGLLSASGKLEDSKVGGPSEELDAKMSRRGMYGAVSRVFPNEFQTLFDYPIPTLSAERRYTTNVALQRLFFLNNEFVHKQAAAMAERVKGAGSDEAQVAKAYQIAFQRDPTAEELAASLALLKENIAPPTADVKAEIAMPAGGIAAKPESPVAMGMDAPPAAAPAKKVKPVESPLEALCWALLSSNEFLFLN